MEKILFTREFLKNWREVGSITPSSKFLVRKMIKSVDWSQAMIVVELGSGSGCITKELLDRMRPEAKLIVFEINDNFCRELRKINDSRMIVYNESALNLANRLNGQSADCIISGIPLSTLEPHIKENLLVSSHRALAFNGNYIHYQFSPMSLRYLKNIFSKVSVDFTPLNIPPAFVFSCVKK